MKHLALPGHIHSQPENGSLVERIDERLLCLVHHVLPEPNHNGIEFLAHLCRLAQVKQEALVSGAAVAIISCQGIPDLIQQPGWKWARETTLRMLQALEALTVLVRFRRARRTEIHISLGHTHFDLLWCCTRFESRCPPGKKTRRFFAHIATRLASFPIDATTDDPSQLHASATKPGQTTVLDRVQQVLEEEGVSATIRARVLHRLVRVLPEPQSSLPSVKACLSGKNVFEGEMPSQQQRTSTSRQTHKASPHHTSQETLPLAPISPLQKMNPEENNRPYQEIHGDQEAEAQEIWHFLYQPSQRQSTPAQVLHSDLSLWLSESPHLVRVAMITTLMQEVFPDARYGELRNRARWFQATYKRYRSGAQGIPDGIASWVESTYSYAEIEHALRAERQRQYHALEAPFRPFVACIELHHLFTENDSETLEPPIDRQDDEAHHRKTGSSPRSHHNHETRLLPPLKGQVFQETEDLHALQAQERVVSVSSPQSGWETYDAARWWHDRVRDYSALASTCSLHVCPTSYGRWVLEVQPKQRDEAPWIWASGKEVRCYLEGERTRKPSSKQRDERHLSTRHPTFPRADQRMKRR